MMRRSQELKAMNWFESILWVVGLHHEELAEVKTDADIEKVAEEEE